MRGRRYAGLAESALRLAACKQPYFCLSPFSRQVKLSCITRERNHSKENVCHQVVHLKSEGLCHKVCTRFSVAKTGHGSQIEMHSSGHSV